MSQIFVKLLEWQNWILAHAPHTCDSWGIDFSLVRYFTILGFSDGRIVAIF
jgi:hypothetical protein